MYGRSDDDWDRMVDDAVSFLLEQAQSKQITTYSDLNSALAQAGHVPFDFSLERDRAAVGAVLGDAVGRTLGDPKVMLSAIVSYIGQNDPGPGFYKLAVELGLLANTATADDKLAFWSKQVNAVHDRYARPTRQRPS